MASVAYKARGWNFSAACVRQPARQDLVVLCQVLTGGTGCVKDDQATNSLNAGVEEEEYPDYGGGTGTAKGGCGCCTAGRSAS